MLKKSSMSALALCSFLSFIPQSHARDFDLTLGGYFTGYAFYNHQDGAGTPRFRHFDLRKETEIHIKGETQLENGTKVGVVLEFNSDRADSPTSYVDESYIYFSGNWGAVRLGEEHGAGYLLQVSPPSADKNIDGIRPEVNSFDLGWLIGANTGLTNNRLIYSITATGSANKVTYFTPVYDGFQMGVTYTPAVSEADQNQLAAITANNNAGQYDDSYEVSAIYKNEVGDLKYSAGAGFVNVDREASAANNDDRQQWDAGFDMNYGNWGVGVSYVWDNNGVANRGDTDIWVFGIDYQYNKYKFGASHYYRTDDSASGTHSTNSDIKTKRSTAGVNYQVVPGYDVNASLSYIQAQSGLSGDQERTAYQFALGTSLKF